MEPWEKTIRVNDVFSIDVIMHVASRAQGEMIDYTRLDHIPNYIASSLLVHVTSVG